MTDKGKYWLSVELVVLFIAVPLLLTAPIHLIIKVLSVLLAITYCVVVGKGMGIYSKTSLFQFQWVEVTKHIIFRFLLFAIVSSLLIWLFQADVFFKVIIEKPILWFFISVTYALFSVYPQELIYRHFFFSRYQSLFTNTIMFVLFNALLFCLAHAFLRNSLVFALTFFGGILFALTYKKNKSLMVVSVEHSLYGVWLFTLGMGDMLAFPGV